MALVSGTTADALAAGSIRRAWVAVIEGYDRLLTDADPTKAVEAWTGTDWSQALGGLVVELRLQQSGDPNAAFAQNDSKCVLHVHPDRDDTFGIELNRRFSGAWTTISGSIDRDDTSFSVRSDIGFDSSGEAHIGTECVAYSGISAGTMTVTDRGLYSAEGVAASGSGETTRFASHHRVSLDQQQVQSNPVISEHPRRWIGRRVYVYLHIRDAEGNLNAKADAQRVFAGRIQGIADDPNTQCTSVSCSHIMNEVGDAIICRNQWGATAMDGIYIPTGAKFNFTETAIGSADVAADELEVVASGASGTNQINAGTYSLEEICSFLNAWLGGETAAARIDGAYSFASPVTVGDGIRTKVDWYRASTASEVGWILDAPCGVQGFLGFSADEALLTTAHSSFRVGGSPNTGQTKIGPLVPWRCAVFAKGGPGGSLPTFQITTESERGSFIDMYELMPSLVKPSMDSTLEWGLFLVDEKILIQASYADGVLSNCFITPFGQSSVGDSNSPQPFYTLGRRADDDSGPVKIRQVFDVECSFKELINILFYSTGTAGYNHDTYDTRAYGFGIGLPGQLLGDDFELSVANLPHADDVMRMRFDEPTRLSELIGGELLARRAFPVWKNGAIVFQRWHTPEVALATFALTESNKASSGSNKENLRTPTLETAAFSRPVVKFDFDPDYTFGRDVRYRATMQLEDQVAVDDGGGEVPSPLTIKLQNTSGKDDPAVIAGYLSTMPMTSRPSRFLVRTIDSRFFEGIAPGDNCTVTDAFARDPVDGTRGIDSRPAIVVRHSYDYGGPTPGGGDPRGMSGEVEINFFDVQRGALYGPSADIDDTVSSGGFSAGYNSSTLEIQTVDHRYSESTEAIDASRFGNSYAVVIVERDPADPAAPVYWQRTLDASAAVSGNKLKLGSALSSPAWDATKKYRVIFDDYTTSTGLQQDNAYQADDADHQVQDVEDPYHFSSTPEPENWTGNTTADPGEFVAELSYGDGKSQDVGHETAIIKSINAAYDYKTAHQVSFLWSEVSSNPGTNTWETRYIGIMYFGQEQCSVAVSRGVTLAPLLAFDNSNTGGATSGDVRITLCRDLPPGTFGGDWSSVAEPTFTENYSQHSWTTSTTTWATGTPTSFAVNVKDLAWGLCYVIVECRNAFCRGLAEGIEGPRSSRIPAVPFGPAF